MTVVLNFASIDSQSNGRDITERQVEILNYKMNLYKGLNEEQYRIGYVYKGDIYTILDETEDYDGVWYKIKTNHGLVGYISCYDYSCKVYK